MLERNQSQFGMKILHYDDAIALSRILHFLLYMYIKCKKEKRKPVGLVAPKHLFGYKTIAKLQIIAVCARQQ